MPLHRYEIEHWATAVDEHKPSLNRSTEIISHSDTKAKKHAFETFSSAYWKKPRWIKTDGYFIARRYQKPYGPFKKHTEYIKVIPINEPLTCRDTIEAGICWQSWDYIHEKCDKIIEQASKIKYDAEFRELYEQGKHPITIDIRSMESVAQILSLARILETAYTSSKTANREIPDEN